MAGWSLLRWLDVSGNTQDVGTSAPLPVQVATSPGSPLAVQAIQPVNFSKASSLAYEASRAFKVAPGTLYGLAGYNSLASSQWIQIYDATALPADGAIPDFILAVPGSSNFSVDFGIFGRPMRNGIFVGNSTTGPTKTIGAANCWFDARFL